MKEIIGIICMVIVTIAFIIHLYKVYKTSKEEENEKIRILENIHYELEWIEKRIIEWKSK